MCVILGHKKETYTGTALHMGIFDQLPNTYFYPDGIT